MEYKYSKQCKEPWSDYSDAMTHDRHTNRIFGDAYSVGKHRMAFHDMDVTKKNHHGNSKTEDIEYCFGPFTGEKCKEAGKDAENNSCNDSQIACRVYCMRTDWKK